MKGSNITETNNKNYINRHHIGDFNIKYDAIGIVLILHHKLSLHTVSVT